MSGTISDLLSSFGDSGFDTVADVPSFDASSLTNVIDESDGLDMSKPFLDTATDFPDVAAPPVPDLPQAPPPPPPETPPPTPAQPPAPAPAPSPAPPAQPLQSTSGMPSTDAAESGGNLQLNPNGMGTTPTTSLPQQPFSLNRAADWFSKLSPSAQAILAGGTAGGASALMGALSQKHMLEYAKERDDRQHQYDVDKEQRARDDFSRRHSVQAIPDGAFRPKGIIDASRGG